MNMFMEKVDAIVDPRLMYNYATFFLYGIRTAFKSVNICYKIHPFESLTINSEQDYRIGFPFIVKLENAIYNIFIDFGDFSYIKEDSYNWADVYAKINVLKDDLSKYSKLLAIGPSFGLKENNIINTSVLMFKNVVKSHGYTTTSIKEYFRDYFYPLYRRESYNSYNNSHEVNDNYIFHASTLWYDSNTILTTNKYRGAFLRACKDNDLIIDGGFFYVDNLEAMNNSEYKTSLYEYQDFLITKRISMKDYIEKTKMSLFVFNTPAVEGCHGWKLAEYLCMGKAIISTPLSREMPGEGLKTGKNIHIVNTVSELYDAVSFIKNNPNYRRHLEKGALEYYDEYLKPDSMIKKIIERCKIVYL